MQMQASSIAINGWEALFTMFTTLEPEDRRMAVLRAIANPKTVIGHSWKDCLFTVTARAANRSVKHVDPEIAARALGIPIQWVNHGVLVWDEKKNLFSEQPLEVMTEMFRNRIRAHLANLEKTQPETHELVHL